VHRGPFNGRAALAAGAGRRCGLGRQPSRRYAGPPCGMTSGGSACLPGSGGRRARCRSGCGNSCVCMPTTNRVLARSEPLRRLAALASQLHQRIDGSGYHWASPGATLSAAARILAAAAYHALAEPRTHCLAFSAEKRRRRCCARYAPAGWTATPCTPYWPRPGHHIPRTPRGRPAGLSEREVKLLGCWAAGAWPRQSRHGRAAQPVA
jgi:hypothetical protein